MLKKLPTTISNTKNNESITSKVMMRVWRFMIVDQGGDQVDRGGGDLKVHAF